MSEIVSIIPQTVSIIAQIIMKYRQSGTDTASIKCLIQEEIRRTQNTENSAAMEKIVDKILDHKQAEELHKTGLEAERYKLEAEYWKKMVEDLQQGEKSVENKLVLSCLVELLKQLKETGHSQKYKKKTTPAQHGSGHRGKFHHRNINSNASYDQNFTQHQSFQQNTDIQQNNNFQGSPHFQQTPRFQRNSQFQKISRFQNPNIHENPTAELELLFAFRGKGQRGRGQQSSSVGWNKTRSELQANDLPSLQQSSHFRSQALGGDMAPPRIHRYGHDHDVLRSRRTEAGYSNIHQVTQNDYGGRQQKHDVVRHKQNTEPDDKNCYVS